MGFFGRFLGKNRQVKPVSNAETARQMQAPRAPTLQTADEQAGVRQRMEAELESQRQRRGQAAEPEA